MSVPKGERGETKLQVLNDARTLSEYTIKLCRNEKVFPKSARWIMSQRIVNECLDMLSCIRKANSAYVPEDVMQREILRYRIQNEVEAYAHLSSLFALIDLAYNVYDIDSRRVEYWTSLAINTESSLKAWTKYDRRRLYDLRKNSVSRLNRV